MTSKQEAEDWKQRQDLEDGGYDVRPGAIRVHGRKETPKHLTVKALVALKLQQAGHGWDTEVKGPGGRVDVLDLGPADGDALVIEVETGVTPKRAREKVDQYMTEAIRDVLVLDPTEAPDDPDAIMDWLDDQLIGLSG